MGLKVGTVQLDEYNPMWKEEFQAEKQNLEKLFGSIALTIEHVGSTAVEGLSAKPIIDISVGVKSLNDFEEIRELFLNNAEYSIKEDSPSDEVLVRKGSEENRTHFIHVMEIESPRYKNTLAFRDYLRNNPEELKAYDELKRDLAEKYSDNRQMYTSSKNDFIAGTLKKATNKNK